MINLNMRNYLPPEQFKKINPEKLGYVLKDGTIQFSSRGAVLEYAKNVVKKGLYAKNPHEVAVAWKDNRVLSVMHGTWDSVLVPKNLPTGASCMHGHILEIPISPTDYLYMMRKNNKEEIALCPSGRYSRIVQLSEENSNCIPSQRKSMETYKTLRKTEMLSLAKSMCKLMPLGVKVLGGKLIGKEPDMDYVMKEFNTRCAPLWAGRVAKTFEKLGNESGVRYESNLICK